MQVSLAISGPAGSVSHTFELASEDESVVVGRSESANVQVAGDSVSRRHFEIRRTGPGLVLIDLGSSAGTSVNGTPASGPVPIETNARIEFGDAVAVMTCGSAVPSSAGFHDAITIETPSRRSTPSEAATIGPGSDKATPRPGSDQPPRTVIGASWAKRAADAAREGGAGATPTVVPDDAAPQADLPPQTLVGATPPSARTRPIASTIPLDRDQLLLGRDPSCDVVISDQLVVSRRHSIIRRSKAGWTITDLNSSNGTFVNGVPTRGQTAIRPGDVISIGAFSFVYDGSSLVAQSEHSGPSFAVDGVCMNKPGGGLILDNISFRIEPGDFVGLIGMSGSGKSRLTFSMCGRAEFHSGDVLCAGQSIRGRMASLSGTIGYVPSSLMLHEPLRVNEALRYISKLRLASDVSGAEQDQRIQSVLDMLSIGHRKSSRIGTLSDGERRRLGLAVELLASPPILLLDEVTTALDLPLHCRLMSLFRDLADRGHSLFLISHHIEDLELCDKWLYLVQGKVAYFGPPDGFLRHFGVSSLREQLDRQGERTADEWAAPYQASLKASTADTPVTAPEQHESDEPAFRLGDAGRQLVILTGRYIKLLIASPGTLGLVGLLAPLIALVMVLLNTPLETAAENAQELFSASLASGRPNPVNWANAVESFKLQERTNVYMLTVSAIVIASFMSVREIVKERRILDHEKFAGVHVVPYLLSKTIVLGTLSAIAAIAVAVVARPLVGHEGLSAPFVPMAFMLALLALSSTCLGLLISSLARSSEQAVFVLIPVLILQLALSGAFPLHESEFSRTVARTLVVNYWGFMGTVDLLEPVAVEGTEMLRAADPESLEFVSEDYTTSVLLQLLHATVYTLGSIAALLGKTGIARVIKSVRRR